MGTYEDYCELIDHLSAEDAAKPDRKKHRLPMNCYAASDCEFFFTVCARHQGMPFTNPDLAGAIVECLLWRKKHHGWMMFCYCLMPDHLHFILKLSPHEAVPVNAGTRGQVLTGVLDQIAGFKSFTTTQIWWKQGRAGRLWQKSSYDRVIRHNDSIRHAASYVLDNPVRKDLVKQWQDYHYSRIVDPW